MEGMVEALRSFQKWMFGFGSPLTMGVVRAVMGTVILINLLMISIDFEAWFTEKGFVPISFIPMALGEMPRFSPLAFVTDARVTLLFFAVTTLAALTTALGLFSRVSTIILLIGITGLHHRTADILHSGDTMMRAFALYMAVAPSGAAFSIDRWWKVRRDPNATMSEVSLWPQRLMQIQVAIVYFTTAWHKWQGIRWRDGSATWFTAQLNEFDRFPMPAFMDQRPMVPIMTYGTLVLELALGTLVFWKPARNYVLIGGVLLHLGIEYRMNIPLFAFIMIGTYLSFIESEEWPSIVAWFNRRFRSKDKVSAEVAENA
ncbi:MAG: HTTM domain-containing protein [Fimbriimonadaceae bacterium]|nr:HTTM domain-containing protein [Fimbriimonadaceae bacterium]